MRATDALVELRRMGKPVLTTEDAALRLRQRPSAATRTLGRLAAAGLLWRLRRGLWTLHSDLDPLQLVEYLTAPFPAYVSFQSALFFHGLVSQVPHVVYAASPAGTRRIKTRLGTYSIHRLAPSFFGGYDRMGSGQVPMATPEKALVDTLYLAPARSRLFARLPEVELPKAFSRTRARRWLAKIQPGPRRRMVAQRLETLLTSRQVNRWV